MYELHSQLFRERTLTSAPLCRCGIFAYASFLCERVRPHLPVLLSHDLTHFLAPRTAASSSRRS